MRTQITARHRRVRLALLAGLIAAPVSIHAAVLLDNTSEPTRDASTIQQDPDLAADPQILFPWAAQSFLTDGQTLQLSSIDVLLGNAVGMPTLIGELRADSGASSPGALLTTFAFGAIPGGAATLNALLPNTSVNLSPATLYWLVLGASGAGSYEFDYAEGNGQIGSGSLGSYAYSDDQGASWTNFGADNPYKLRVNVEETRVPAPVDATLLAAGLVGLLWIRRRRNA